MSKRNPPRVAPRVALRILKDCVTENDGESYDLVRILSLLFCVPTIFIFQWAIVYTTLGRIHFDWGGFAMACGGLSTTILALATGTSIKARTDPIGSSPPMPTPNPPQDHPPC